jgi:myo-inositol catabolism protein IolC
VKVGRFDSVVAGKGLSRVKDFKHLRKKGSVSEKRERERRNCGLCCKSVSGRVEIKTATTVTEWMNECGKIKELEKRKRK